MKRLDLSMGRDGNPHDEVDKHFANGYSGLCQTYASSSVIGPKRLDGRAFTP